MSLVDELLADFDEIAYEDKNLEVEHLKGNDNKNNEPEENVIPLFELNKNQHISLSSFNFENLMDDEKLTNLTDRINKYIEVDSATLDFDKHYKLMVDANEIVAMIDNDISRFDRQLRLVYSKRFPELESLVSNPIDYCRTVGRLGNDIERGKSDQQMLDYMNHATVMVVSVSASSSQGVKLDQEELEHCKRLSETIINLYAEKTNILDYIESRMEFIAPNLAVVVSPSIAAKLLGCAGGLKALCKIPANCMQLLGAKRKILSGFSTITKTSNRGYIWSCDIVENAPTDIRQKIARTVAAKATLAARIDMKQSSLDGELGRQLRSQIEMKMEKFLEPAAVKRIKSLPAPIDYAHKKRGGKRYRRMKERLGITDVRKAANRMTFGEIEQDAYHEILGPSLGHLGKSGSGKIRTAMVDSKTKARMSKTLQNQLYKSGKMSVIKQAGVATSIRRNTGGTQSSVAFTPLQGLEIINPNAIESKETDAQKKYFGTMSTFNKS
ncbi:Pre-mRNA-processing factor 31 [Intoshia linei]|uniref:U4/U6 small nuclear ribonucleoprotein Prp31 n=1 Tax=Intoshia linei TaxID=1819745 RepID=A0A177BD54_9BILA|nr:Pre-mRNA-processing factor 31 [Intoshia linei]